MPTPNPASPLTPAADVDAGITVNDLLQQHPSVIGVLNAHGVDACCGGHLTLAESAAHDNLDLPALLAALRAALAAEAR